MNLVILHYHLDRGGVTQVIQSHLRALATDSAHAPLDKVVVISGERTSGWRDVQAKGQTPLDLVTSPTFDYDRHPAVTSPTELEFELTQLLVARGFSTRDTVLHLHNATIGKKVAWPTVVASMAANGWRWLLQIHDFAEDFRPENYAGLTSHHRTADRSDFEQWLYPRSERIRYATLNSRDQAILVESGIPQRSVDKIPNPIANQFAASSETQRSQRIQDRLDAAGRSQLVLYPVRGIRRKNLLEFLLWAAVSDGQTQFALTLPGESEQERGAYLACRALSDSLRLPVWWEVGLDPKIEFEQWMSSADPLISTSVAEGFGMVFVEALAWKTKLIGRDLPDITDDFKIAGLRFPGLSATLEIPSDLVSSEACVEQLATAYAAVANEFRMTFDGGELRSQLESTLRNESIDFARLPIESQCNVIRKAASDNEVVRRIRQRNPNMNIEFGQEQVESDWSRQQQLLQQNFGLAATAIRLRESYKQVLKGDDPRLEQTAAGHATQAANPPVDPTTSVLEQFMGVSRFFPVRVASEQAFAK